MDDGSAERELLTWELFGSATRELVRNEIREHVAETRCAVLYQKPRSVIDADYVWRHTNRWINFPWSSPPPVLAPDG